MSKPVILVVDDEPANQFLLEGLLNANHYEPVVASNGSECLEILENQKPDLILLDIMMPKMTGIEVLEQIMQSDALKIIPVIMVSAKTSSADIQEALNLGAIDYIKKPFDEMELLARVKVGIRLKQNEDGLREMVQQRDDFVRIISHDLRSPFSAIHGFAEIIAQSDNLSEHQRKSLDYIIKSVEFSDEYFNKLLSWSMLSHGDLSLTRKIFPLSIFIESIFCVFNKKAEEKHIRLINQVEQSTLINADETFFRQAVSNLVNNAIKFTDEKGEIALISKKNGEGILLIVSDNGVGMPEDLSNEKLFSSGLTNSLRGTHGEKGTGIGLNICKKILDAHGFGIHYQNKDSGGTDFVIHIPHSASRIGK